MASGRAEALAWDVFLAYPRAERAQARALYDALTSGGLRVCFDQTVLRPGDDWHALLPRYIRSSRIVVALISAATKQAHFERSEVLLAIDMVRREGRRLVPVRLDPAAQPPYGTEQLHMLDMLEPDDLPEAAARILDVARHPTDVPALSAVQVFCQRTPIPPRFFMGRDDVLRRLGVSPRTGAATVLTQTLNGLGGVGKTSLAAAAVEAHRHEFDIVWWVRADDVTVLASDLAELAPALGLPVLDEPEAIARTVRDELQATTRSWLLVLDNATDGRSVEQWMPRRGNGTVLITSRSTEFNDIDTIVDVDTFPPALAERFLQHRVSHRNPAAAEEPLAAIVERLDGLPLALEQAAAWVAQVPNRRFADFVTLYDDVSADPFPDGTRPGGYDHTATTAWRISLAAATERAPLAQQVMAMFGYLAPDDLPCRWVREMAGDEYFGGAGAGSIAAALDALHLYSLVKISEADSISVHRVVQAAARRAGGADAASAAVRVLWAQVPADMSDPRDWAPVEAVASHALAVVTQLQPVPLDEAERLCDVLHAVATYQRGSGGVNAAIATSTIAQRIASTYLGPDHPTSLRARADIANSNYIAKRYPDAITLYETLIADCEQILGADHPTTLSNRHQLARAHRDQGTLVVAIPMLEALLSRRQELLSTDHPDILHSRHSVAGAYAEAGDIARSTPMLEAVVADRERVLGHHHPDTANSRNSLGGRYMNAQTPDLAIPLFQTNLAYCEEHWPANHPFTLASRNNLARAYQQAGQLDLALPLLQKNLEESERLLGSDHPQTLVGRDRLALAYQASGEVDRAVAMFEDNLARTKRVLGPTHIESLWSTENLGLAYRAAGDTESGNTLLRAALIETERPFGLDHPRTKRSRLNLTDSPPADGVVQRDLLSRDSPPHSPGFIS